MTARLPLAGINVIDLTWVAFGPWVTKFLADHGAEVIKIESTTRPDIIRLSPPYKDNIAHPDRAGLFTVFNSSKRSLTLNLKSPKGIDLLKKLVRWADIVVENMGVGAMKGLGMEYDQLIKIKRDIIMVSMSILGQTGPLSSFQGFGPHGAALSGVYALTGWPDGEPASNTLAWPDCICPWYATTAIMAALDYRRRTSKGQFIDISQVETTIHGFAPALLRYSANNEVTRRMGNRCDEAVPHGVFRCQGFDRWCAIAVWDDSQWKSLCKIMGKEEWKDKYATLKDRKAQEDTIEKAMDEWTSPQTPEEVMQKLQSVGVPAGIVQNTENLFADPQLQHREHFPKLDHPVMGKTTHPSWPAKFSVTPGQLTPAPTLGQDNEYVCTRILGLSDEEFVELIRSGVLE